MARDLRPILERLTRRRTWRRGLPSIALLLFVAACAGQAKTPAPAPPKIYPSDIERMFSLVLDNVHDFYIDEYPVDGLAISALRGLKKVDPDAAIERTGGQVRLLISGTVVSQTPEPETNDGTAWAAIMDRLIVGGRQASTRLNSTNNESMYKSAIDSLLADLDRYSRYAGAASARRNRQNRDGFGGIGVSIKSHAEGVQVETVTEDLPAFRGGVKTGDIIVAVSGRSLKGRKLRDIVSMLRGPVSTTVSIALRREGRPEPLELVLFRTKIIPKTVHYERRDRIAYLKMTGFNQGTVSAIENAVDRARREIGSDIKGLVIDLRGNPGGLLDQAVDAADLFLVGGRISTTSGRHPDSVQLFDATRNEIGKGIPIAVLVNGASASASEVLAAALQDRGRAVLIGSGSFGKGTVQTVLRTPNDGELVLTWARLHAPSGYILNKLGVLPTVCTSNAEDIGRLLDEALKKGVLDRRIRLRRAADNADETVQESIRALCPWRPRDGNDLDIEVAKRILETPELYQRALRLSAPTAGS